MIDYTRTFHGKKISVTGNTLFENVELDILEKKLISFESEIEDYTSSIGRKLSNVKSNCDETYLKVNNQTIDVAVEALRKEIEVLRDDYNNIIKEIKYELKTYKKLRNESYEAYKKYLKEQEENQKLIQI